MRGRPSDVPRPTQIINRIATIIDGGGGDFGRFVPFRRYAMPAAHVIKCAGINTGREIDADILRAFRRISALPHRHITGISRHSRPFANRIKFMNAHIFIIYLTTAIASWGTGSHSVINVHFTCSIMICKSSRERHSCNA